jgi:Rhodopirellula transposase DDE domain
MELTDALRTLLVDTAASLRGAPRRRFMAQTVDRLGLGQRQAQQLLGWTRDTLRKGLHELRSGITCLDAAAARGRKPVEFHLPQLRADIEALVEEHCQTDPTFQTTRRFCRLSAAAVRRQLIAFKGYTDEQLPSIQTITTKLNVWGFRLRKVAKCRPQKKFPKPTPSSTN